MAKILVIDDSEIIRNLLSEYLQEIGHEVDLATDGLEGIQKALTEEYAVIFSDIHMPKRNGYQVFTEVMEAKPGSKFIMTDSMPDVLAKLALEEGAVTCLIKPFDLESYLFSPNFL